MSSHVQQLRLAQSIQTTHNNAICQLNAREGSLLDLHWRIMIAFVRIVHPIIHILVVATAAAVAVVVVVVVVVVVTYLLHGAESFFRS